MSVCLPSGSCKDLSEHSRLFHCYSFGDSFRTFMHIRRLEPNECPRSDDSLNVKALCGFVVIDGRDVDAANLRNIRRTIFFQTKHPENTISRVCMDCLEEGLKITEDAVNQKVS